MQLMRQMRVGRLSAHGDPERPPGPFVAIPPATVIYISRSARLLSRPIHQNDAVNVV